LEAFGESAFQSAHASRGQCLGMIQSQTQLSVRYAETDMMGVVYHGSYLPWFEIGRTTLLKECGLPYRQLEADGFFLPVLEVTVKYNRPALYDDVLTIVTTMTEKPTLRIRLNYRVLREEVLLATGQTMHAFIDRQGRPVRPPALFAKKMSDLFRSKPSLAL
jgi:acyl-CoA thioester hydrolase